VRAGAPAASATPPSPSPPAVGSRGPALGRRELGEARQDRSGAAARACRSLDLRFILGPFRENGKFFEVFEGRLGLRLSA